MNVCLSELWSPFSRTAGNTIGPGRASRFVDATIAG